MSKIKRYDNSRKEGIALFFKAMGVTLLCISALAAGFIGAAYFF